MDPSNKHENERRAWSLMDSEERFKMLAEASFEGIVVSSEGRVIDVNDQFAQMSGYSREELIDKPVLDLIAPESREITSEAIRTGRLDLYITTMLRKNGEKLLVETRARSAKIGDSTVRIAVVLDVTERTRAGEALRQSTEELDRIFNLSLDMLCIADTDGYFRRMNHTWEQVLGYPAKELEGRKFLDFVHPDDAETTLQAIGELSQGKQVIDYVNRYRRKDGSYRWIEWRSRPYGNLIYAAARDITERKQAEIALQESRQKYLSLFNSMTEGVSIHDVVYDEEGRPVNYVLVDVNPAYESILKMKREDVVGRTGSEVYGTDHPPYLEVFAGVADTGRPVYFETYFEPLGIYFAISVFSPGKGKFAAAFSDITERKAVEKALRGNEAMLKESQRVAELGHYHFDARSGTWIGSDMLGEIFGIDVASGRTSEEWVALIHPDERNDMP